MVSRNRKALSVGLILIHLITTITTLVGPMGMEALADATTPAVPGATANYSPFNFTGTPVSFQVAQSQTLSNLYGSCFNISKDQTDPLVSSIVQLTTGKDKDSKSGAPGTCGSVNAAACSAAVPNVNPSCPETLAAVDDLFGKLIKTASDGECCVRGKMSQLEEASKEITCINQQNDLLAQQIKSMQADLQSKFQQAQKDLSQIDTVVGDRVNQMQFIQTKLGGDKENGNGGLLKLQADMQKVVNGDLPLKVKGFEDTITAFNQQQVIFQQRVDNQKMALAKQCFTSPEARYKCAVNSQVPCSFAQLIEAKYYELSRTVNGQIQRNNKANQAQAQSMRSSLDYLFQTIFSDMASDTKLVATTQQEAQNQQAASGDNHNIKTPADLQKMYGAQLASFNLQGLDVQQLFLNKFAQCYQDAQSTVNSSMSDPTSQYSLSVAFMQKQQKDLRDGFIQFYKGYGDMYTQFWSTMGQTAPLDTSKCSASSTPIAGMLQCAKDLATNLEGAYTGTTPNSSVTIQMKGNSTNPVTQFNFTCNGVNGCVTVMQNLTTNLKSETQKLDQSKKNYIQQANQSLEQYKSQLSQVLSVQNQMLMQRLTTLKARLGPLGVSDPLQTQPIQKEKMTKSKTRDSAGNEYEGLYEMPENILAVVGGDLSPPMIDPNSSTFDSARMAIAQAMSTDRGKDAEFTNLLATLQKQKTLCKKEVGKGQLERTRSIFQQLTTACATVDNDTCTKENQSITNAITVLNDDYSGFGLDVTSVSALGDGIKKDCGKAAKMQSQLDNLETAISQIPDCKSNADKNSDCLKLMKRRDRMQEQVDNMGLDTSTGPCMSLSSQLVKGQKDSSSDGDSQDDGKGRSGQ